MNEVQNKNYGKELRY